MVQKRIFIINNLQPARDFYKKFVHIHKNTNKKRTLPITTCVRGVN